MPLRECREAAEMQSGSYAAKPRAKLSTKSLLLVLNFRRGTPATPLSPQRCLCARHGHRVRGAMSRRDQIKLGEEELRELLEAERIAVVSSNGPRGWPHSMPLWFVPREGEVWIWTYAKSQKVRNLERDPRATVLVETGHEYGELRGAMIEAEAALHRDFETVIGFAEELTVRYAEGISAVEGDAKAALEAQAPKRVAIQFRQVRLATWDHRKLGGTY